MNFIKSNAIFIGLICFSAIFLLRYLDKSHQLSALGLLFASLGVYGIWQFFQHRQKYHYAYPVISSLLILFSLANLIGIIKWEVMTTALSYMLACGVLLIFKPNNENNYER